jgi:alkylhydroperoxidase family enzyme
MASTFRIPATPLTGLRGRLLEAWARRTYGQVPDGAYVYGNHPRVLRDVLTFERHVQRWGRLDRNLAAYATMAAASVVGCSWCLDFGYFMAHHDGLDEHKVREVPRWRDSEAFSDVERDVLEYAEQMSVTPPAVDDALSRRLQQALGTAAVVELTQLVALENMRSRFNSAAGLESQGFSAACDLPLAVASVP